MEVKITRLTNWELVVKEARATSWKAPLGREPSQKFKMEALMSRHSPIQALLFEIELKNIKSWISVHLVRHHLVDGHWVSSQRPDRHNVGKPRDELTQGALVNHNIILNAQEIIAISKKRLCSQASKETREVWAAVVKELKNIGEVELAAFCKPECWWSGGCTETMCCGRTPQKEMPPIEG